jgi:hypothetical protein
MATRTLPKGGCSKAPARLVVDLGRRLSSGESPASSPKFRNRRAGRAPSIWGRQVSTAIVNAQEQAEGGAPSSIQRQTITANDNEPFALPQAA